MSSDPTPETPAPGPDAADASSPPADAGEAAPEPAAPARQVTKRLAKRRWKRRLIALSFGTLLCLALTECGVRLAWRRLVYPWEQPLMTGSSASLGQALIEESLRGPGDGLRHQGASDPLYMWDPRENLRHRASVSIPKRRLQGTSIEFQVSTDANGLRGPLTPVPIGALKVLCLGDSMTFGQGVDDAETFPAQLEAQLQKVLERPVRVFNAGVISLGQREQIGVAKRLLPILEPDLVLLQFTVANDVMDDHRWEDALSPEGELVPRANPCGNLNHHLALTNPLARWSRAYRFLVWRYGRHAIKYRYMVEDENLDLAAGLTLELYEACKDRGGKQIPSAVLIAPSVVQVERGFAERLLRTARINEGVRARLEAKGVPCRDLLPPLRAAADAGADLYIPVDRHWNPAGNAAVAAQAVEVCRELLKAP